MIKIKILKNMISFLLIASFIFVTIDFSVTELGDFFQEVISENQSVDLSDINSYSFHAPHILKKLDVLADHQFLRISSKTTKRFERNENHSQRITYITIPLVKYMPVILYSQDYYNVISSGKSRLSVLALSLGGNSPPVIHV